VTERGSVAFVFVDLVPSVRLPRVEFAWRPAPVRQDLGGIAPSQNDAPVH